MTNAQLENEINVLKSKLDSVLNILTSRPIKTTCTYSFYSWLDEWVATYKLPKLKPSSLYQIKNCIKTHIKPNIDDCSLLELKPLDIQKGLNAITSSRMKKYARDTLNDSLRQAYKLDIIPENIMLKVDSVTHNRNKGKSLTLEQEKHFLDIIKGNRLENLYLFYLFSGIRKSEALSIKWEHIDYKNNRIFIDGTKTTCSKRFIPLFDDLKVIISRLPKTSEYIFPYADYTIKNSFRWLKNKYKLPYSIHSLRHTFSTRCFENNIKPKTVQKWLGHSKLDTTQNIYTDVLIDFEQTEISKVNSFKKLQG